MLASEGRAAERWSENYSVPDNPPAASAPATTRWSENYEVPAAPAQPAPPKTGSSPAGKQLSGMPAAASPSPAGSGSSLCQVGMRVDVRWGSLWYPARVLAAPDALGTCHVRFEGDHAHSDDRVALDRLRPVSSPPPAPAPVPRQVPEGRYACYTYDGGQLNYTYTDVLFSGADRYAVGGQGGRYQLARDGALRFTGHLANARGRYQQKQSGAEVVELVFNGDRRASMSCSRAR